ncbi:MAG: DUF3343 domain-containing protein [Clostridia bacterium]|nr:DUF3343 domain-containing protein [Clostridia bacterium]
MEEFLIISFRSRTQVMHFARILRGAGIFSDIISTPRQVAVGCGLSVKVKETDRLQALTLMKQANLEGYAYTARQEYGTIRLFDQNPR